MSGQDLSDDQIDVLKLGLRHGFATRQLKMMSISEDQWDQINKLDQFKDGNSVKDRLKNSLRSFTYNYLDLDLQQFHIDNKRIRILRSLNAKFAILKPDKGNGIISYSNAQIRSTLSTHSLMIQLNSHDLTSSRLSTLQVYLRKRLNRGEISEWDHEHLRLTFAHFGRAHGLPKTHKTFQSIPKFRPIIDTTNTPHYNVGKFLAGLLNPLTLSQYSLRDSFDAADAIKLISPELFSQGYKFVSFDVESLFTNVPLRRTINVVLDRIYNKKLIETTPWAYDVVSTSILG